MDDPCFFYLKVDGFIYPAETVNKFAECNTIKELQLGT